MTRVGAGEGQSKSLILMPAGIPVPRGELCTSAREAADAVRRIGPAVIKAQVAIGGRGKAGGIKLANTPEEAERVASAILGMTIGPSIGGPCGAAARCAVLAAFLILVPEIRD